MTSRDWTHAERSLELPRLLEIVAAHCETGLGQEAVLGARPSFDREVISLRLGRMAEAVALDALPIYSNARDVRSAIDAAGKGSMLPGTELFRIGETLGAMARLRAALIAKKETSPRLWAVAEALVHKPELASALEAAIGPEGQVLDAASSELKSIRSKLSTQNKKILDKLQSLVSSLRSYLQEPLFTEREGRYVVPVKSQYRAKVPGIVHDASGSGQTVFVEPEAVVGEMNRLRELQAAEKEEVERILLELSKRVGDSASEIATGIEALAELDAVFAGAKYAHQAKGIEPQLTDGNLLDIRDGHHPLLSRDTSVPLTVGVGGSYRSLLITGPNTGGKTVCLKTLGLYALMMGCGLFPPAKSVRFGPFSGIWADIGDEQSLQQSLSTFSGHQKNIARVFSSANSGALVLFDEIGAGTDPQEGAALAKAILTKLIERGIVVAASTHYGELKDHALHDERFTCAAMEFDLASLRPTYRLIMGASGASHAFEVSRRHGLPSDVVNLAEESLGEEAKDERSKGMALDALVAQTRKEREEAEGIRRELEAQYRDLEREKDEAKQKVAKLRERSEAALEEALREARARYRELLERVSEVSGKERESLIKSAKDIERQLASSAQFESEDKSPSQALSEGMSVTVKGHPQLGKVLSIERSGNVIVQMGQLRLTLKPEDVSPATAKAEPKKQRRVTPSLSKAQSISSELMLRMMNAESAIEALERFFDDAALAGIHRVRIVHGKGEGILRRVVKEFLQGKRDVKRYYEAAPEEGGSGVTIVEF